MKKNIGTLDKGIRVVIALVLIVLYVMGYVPAPWNIVAIVVAIVLLLTSITGFCGIYTLFGIQTCPMIKR